MRNGKKPKIFGRPAKFNPDRHPLDIFILARTGKTNFEIALSLGITDPTFNRWLRHYPSAVYALERARASVDDQGRTNAEQFKEYVYNRLPPDLQQYWKQIDLWHDHRNGAERIEAILENTGTHVRQSLWLHAMIQTNFNSPLSCRMVNITRAQLNSWTDNDPKFPRLLDEIIWCKKHFFESALIGLVQEGNVMATIFANRTQNRDMGYGEKIEVSGTIQHAHEFSIDQLDLRLETRREILDAMRAYREKQRVVTEQRQIAQANDNANEAPAIEIPAHEVSTNGSSTLADLLSTDD